MEMDQKEPCEKIIEAAVEVHRQLDGSGKAERVEFRVSPKDFLKGKLDQQQIRFQMTKISEFLNILYA
jgi:hypothetical protein